jgi:AcrR family transcriptional regulator
MGPIDLRIFQAASDLLHQFGDSFTIDQLVDKANVPRATIYRRMGSKEALLQRLAQEQGVVRDHQGDVRTRILRAARQVFGRLGPVHATIEQVADEARVGVATVYRHFGDKDRLVWAFMAELSLRPVVRDLVHPTEDVAADLRMLTTSLLPFFYEYRDILRFILTGNQAERAYIEHLRTGSDRTLDQLASYFATQIEAGHLPTTQRPQELALAYMGLLLAFAVIGPTHYGTTLEEPERISDLIVGLFVGGLIDYLQERRDR